MRLLGALANFCILFGSSFVSSMIVNSENIFDRVLQLDYFYFPLSFSEKWRLGTLEMIDLTWGFIFQQL